jgi:hypothetical protein
MREVASNPRMLPQLGIVSWLVEAEEPWRSGNMGNLRLSPILKSSDTAAPRGVAVLS